MVRLGDHLVTMRAVGEGESEDGFWIIFEGQYIHVPRTR